MKKNELASMTIAELKALALKKKIALPAIAKKADIVTILAKAFSARAKKAVKTTVKKSAKQVAQKATKAAAKQQTVKRKGTAGKKAIAKKAGAERSAEQALPRREWQMPAGVEEPLMAQERVSDAKYYTGLPEHTLSPRYDTLPHEYGEERMALMARDPYLAYGYWELPQSRLEKEKALFGWDSRLCVRVYDVTGVQGDVSNATAYFDQEVHDRVGDWYFDFGRPAHSFRAELGLLAPDGRFLSILRSPVVTMPRDGVSDVMDEEWMLMDEEFMKLYGVHGQVAGGPSSLQVREIMRQRREMDITSPGMVPKRKPGKK